MYACTRVYVFMYVHVRAGGVEGCYYIYAFLFFLLLSSSLLLFVFFGRLGRGVTQGAAGFALGETDVFHTQHQGRSRPLEARQDKAQSLCKNVHTLR